MSNLLEASLKLGHVEVTAGQSFGCQTASEQFFYAVSPSSGGSRAATLCRSCMGFLWLCAGQAAGNSWHQEGLHA